ncbi:MAG TPA: TylF/MycF family methyltransferase [Patescibacteria group bacterium]
MSQFDKDSKELYLELTKRCLINSIYQESKTWNQVISRRLPVKLLNKILTVFNLGIFFVKPFDQRMRESGQDWPMEAHTMIGLKRLDNIQYCAEKLIKEGISGDFIETGVWRGGACIFMRAILKAYNVKDRRVWLADSFEGLPKPDVDKYPLDKEIPFHSIEYLKVSLEEVKTNFKRYGLLDQQVNFLKGWFRETLPKAPLKKLALIRLDGDMYESTAQALEYLYPKLAIGGYLIVDDYGAIDVCRQAVQDYRRKHRITDKIIKIDWSGAYWRRSL